MVMGEGWEKEVGEREWKTVKKEEEEIEEERKKEK